MTIRIDRLPRLPTDQTATVMNVASGDIVDVLLQALTRKAPMPIA